MRRLARRQVEHGDDYLERWYAERYGKPPIVGDFEDKSAGFWHLEMLRDLWHRRTALLAQDEALVKMGIKGKPMRLERERIYQQINAINRVFGAHSQHADPVVAKWDAIIAAGGTPDFSRR